MTQLRQSYDTFVAQDTVIIAVGPENQTEFQTYFTTHSLPFIGVPDPNHKIALLYGQQVNVFRAGRMPAQFLIRKDGKIHFTHFGSSMSDIPTPRKILARVRSLSITN